MSCWKTTHPTVITDQIQKNSSDAVISENISPEITQEIKLSSWSWILQTQQPESEEICITFDDFNELQKNNWVIVNDGVMWWLSKGKYQIQDSILTFSWNINTNGGGFSSIRSRVELWLLEQANYMRITAKPDSRKYTITFRDNNTRWISYQYNLDFKNIWWFEQVTVPLDELTSTYFGRNIRANSFQKQSTREIGFILSDGFDGPFQLEIDDICYF
jgi:hypothetical protein